MTIVENKENVESRAARFPLHEHYEVQVTRNASHCLDAETVTARLLDISSHGILLQASCEISVGELLRVNFMLKEMGSQINMQATVSWKRQEQDGKWTIGGVVRPQIPKAVLNSLAAGKQIERRDSIRSESVIRATAVWNLGDDPFAVILCNYSPGGFSAVMKEAAQPDARIHLRVEGTAPGPQVVHGDVRSVAPLNDGYVVGCAFLDERAFHQLQAVCGPSD